MIHNDELEVSSAAGTSEKRRTVIAVGGGKGGIGKSILAANLGVFLSRRGKRVVLIDADLGGANLHTCLGIPAPAKTLSDFVERRVEGLQDVVSATLFEGLGLISGALDFLSAANPKYQQKLRLLREINRLNVDYVIIDLGGGTGFNILDFFLIADHGILTVVPEPTSIENAYRFIKAAYYRRIKTLHMNGPLRGVIEDVLRQHSSSGITTPADLVRLVGAQSPEAGKNLRQELDRLPLKLVVNQARSREEAQLGKSISDACRRYFGIRMEFLGAVPYDDAVWRSIRQRRPVVAASPDSPAAMAITDIAVALGIEV